MSTPLRASLTYIQAADNRDEVLRCMVRGAGDCLSAARLYTVKDGSLTARLRSVGREVEEEQANNTFRPDHMSVIGRVVDHGGLYVGPLPRGDTTRLLLPPGSPGEREAAVAAVRIRRRTVAVLVGQPVGEAAEVRGQLQALVNGAAASLAGLIVRTRDPGLEALRHAGSPDELLETLVRVLSNHLAAPHGFVVRDGALYGRFAFVDGDMDARDVRLKSLSLEAVSVATRAVHNGLVLLGPCPADDPVLGLVSKPMGEEVHLGLVPIAVRRRTVCLVAGFVSPGRSDQVATFLRRVQKQGADAFGLLILKSKDEGEAASAGASEDVVDASLRSEASRASGAARSLAVVGVVMVFILLVAFWYGLFFDKNPVREIRRLVPALSGVDRQGPAVPSASGSMLVRSSMEVRLLGPRKPSVRGCGTKEGADRCCVRAC